VLVASPLGKEEYADLISILDDFNLVELWMMHDRIMYHCDRSEEQGRTVSPPIFPHLFLYLVFSTRPGRLVSILSLTLY
jgi:hypothetical protein